MCARELIFLLWRQPEMQRSQTYCLDLCYTSENLKAYAWQPGAGQATIFGLWCGKIGPTYVGPSRAHVEPSGPSWAYIGPGWAYVGLCWAHLGPMLGLCSAHVGLCWPYVAPCWAILGAMLGPCLGHLCWNDLKMQFFSFPGPSSSPKPRKKTNKIRGHRKARNTVEKKRFFFSPASKKHPKLQVLQSGGGGSAAGPAAPITFGYHRRPPARTRAPWPAPGLHLSTTIREAIASPSPLLVWDSQFTIEPGSINV